MARQTDVIRKDWESNGWFVINLIATNKNGICDYLMMKQCETDVFVESKEIKDELSELQKYRINQLLELGKIVMVNDKEITEPFIFETFNF